LPEPPSTVVPLTRGWFRSPSNGVFGRCASSTRARRVRPATGVASSDSVGFACRLRFAPLGRHVNDAVFRRESFFSTRRLRSGFHPTPTLCAFRLREPARLASILTSPVGQTVRREASTSRRRAERCHRSGAAGLADESACRLAQDWSPACRLELTASQPRMPLIGSTLIFRRGVAARSETGMKPTSQLGHPCCSSQHPAGQGDGTPARARLTRAAEATTLPRGRHRRDCDPAETRCLSPISATNLLSTSTPETHQLSRAKLSLR